jgi:hypothetical protein
MTVTEIGVIPAPIEVISSHEPFIHNGEAEIAKLLLRRGYVWRYEPRFYPLTYPVTSGRICYGGFTPDFYLPPTAHRPPINIEVTFADHGLPMMPREQYRGNQERLRLKRLKITMTSDIYKVETILVTYSIFLNLRRDCSLMDHLIKNAAQRHIRNAA